MEVHGEEDKQDTIIRRVAVRTTNSCVPLFRSSRDNPDPLSKSPRSYWSHIYIELCTSMNDGGTLINKINELKRALNKD